MKAKRFFTLRKIALGGGIFLGLTSLTAVGFSSWTLVNSSAETNLEVSVGEDGRWTYNLNDHVTWSFLFPEEYNVTHGFSYPDTGGFSYSLQARVNCVIQLNDGDETTHDFFDYYDHSLASNPPTSFTFNTTFSKDDTNASYHNIKFTSITSGTAHYTYNYNTDTGGKNNYVSTNKVNYSSNNETSVSHALTVDFPGVDDFKKWNYISLHMEYWFDLSSYVTESNTFENVMFELGQTVFSASLSME